MRSRLPLLMLLALLALLPGCSRPDPEERLRTRFGELREAVEQRNASRLRDYLGEDFIGNDGLDREQLRAMAAMQFLRNQRLGVNIGPLDVQLQPGGTATVRFTAFMTGGSGGWMPERAQAYTVTTSWREQDDVWWMYHAEWAPQL